MLSENETRSSVAAVQEVLLEMLVDIDRICRTHGLHYTLYCGTLLGAVRSGEMIPWDDDADLMMPIEDYRVFARLAPKELGERYELQHLGNTPAHPWLWMRVFRRGTTYLRRDWAELEVSHAVALDIYPMIGAANSPRAFLMQRAVLDLANALRHIDYWRVTSYPKDKRQKRIGKALALMPRPFRRGLSLLLARLASPSPQRKKRCCTLDGAPFVPKYDSADWIDTIELPLCGRLFLAPARYDKLLRTMYGDYLTPPPEGDRHGHGDAYGGVIIDVEQDFRAYLPTERN